MLLKLHLTLHKDATNSQDPDETAVKVRVNALQVVQCYLLRQQLFVERQSEASIEVMTMEYGDTNDPTDKVKV